MNSPRIGSVCSGYRGLDAAVEAVFGGTTAWVSDVDPGANRILAHHWPTTPNLGDLTTTDWTTVEPVDILAGGYPCQPFSTAGKRKGTSDERHIWPYIADALRVLRPRVAIFENVAGHLRLGFDTVLADLAALGFDAEWCLVRASEVGAPHRRERLFVLATAADTADLGHERGRGARRRGDGPTDHRQPASDADGGRLAGHPERDGRPNVGQPERASRLDPVGRGVQRAAAADTKRVRLQGERSHAGADSERAFSPTVGRGLAGAGVDAAATDWGRFAPAVARWEAVTGRPAPWATDDRRRLSPRFVEWLMGLPAGHVTDVPELTRTQQLKALGNGVVPQQAEAAIRLLAARAGIPLPATHRLAPAA